MATKDNMLCGTYLKVVIPKYDTMPDSYFRCRKCGLAACYDRSCSGKADYFWLKHDKRGLYECIRYKPPQKPRKRRKLSEIAADPNAKKKPKRKLNPLFKSQSSQPAESSQGTVAQTVDLTGAPENSESSANDELDFELKRPDVKDRAAVDNYVIDSLFLPHSVFKDKYRGIPGGR